MYLHIIKKNILFDYYTSLNIRISRNISLIPMYWYTVKVDYRFPGLPLTTACKNPYTVYTIIHSLTYFYTVKNFT